MSIRHASEESMMEIDVADAKRVRSGSIFMAMKGLLKLEQERTFKKISTILSINNRTLWQW